MNARALPFRTGGSTGATARKSEDWMQGEESGGVGARRGGGRMQIFTRKGVSVIYWKSLPRSCGFVAALPEQRISLVAKKDARCVRRN